LISTNMVAAAVERQLSAIQANPPSSKTGEPLLSVLKK